MAYLVHVSCLSTTTVSQLFEPQLQKIVIFTYPGLHFLFALRTPLWQSRKTLHKWKDNSVLAKPLAACIPIYLQQFPSHSNRKCKKIAVFSCLNRSFLHLYLQFYYISVAVNWYRVGGTEHVIPTIFEVLLYPSQPLPSSVLKSLL